jgi:hypothetical protein
MSDVVEERDTGLLEVGEIVAVMDDAHGIGLHEPDPDRVAEVVVIRVG